ncbi:MAG TPA: AAA family ATPase, partial [Myxococcota bacterium]|nr:AAA family ATPase [Myxococcota bacterium]
DARADVFSLGCVLFECLTGRPAFAADHPLALLARILLEDPPRVRDVRPDVAAPLDELVARMLAKQPDERPADGAAVAAELARVTAALGAGERAAPAPARAAALTASEQRLVCVVLIAAAGEAAPGADGALAETVASDVAQRAGEAFVAAAARFGGRATGLADGSVVVTLLGSEAATDQAVQAARCALSLRALAGARAMVLATGRGDVSGRWPVGQVVERAAALLRAGQGSDAAAGAAGAAIRVDEVTAGLLDARFEVAGDAAGLVLQREREPLDEARRLLGRPTPFVGREAELGALEAAFAQCVAEPAARAVLVTAPAGMGKSRLRQELLARLGAHAVPASAAAAAVAPAAVAVSPVAAGVGAAAGAAAAAGAFSAAGAAPAGGVSPAAGAAAAGGVAPAAGAAPAPAVPLVLGARGDPMRAGSLFGLVAQLVRRAAGVQEGEPPPARRQKLRARLARHLRDPDALARVAEFLGEMIGVPADGEPSPPMRSARNDPRVMGDQMREAFEDWLGAECAAGPVLIVLEDLHWGDFPSVSFVDGALRRFADRPLMVLGLARPEVQTLFPDLWADRHVQEVRLGQLGRRSGERLARAVLGAAASDETVARIVERAAGNAFYLEELIRAVAAGGGEALPETVLAMVQARLAALDPAARRVLRAASVFGETFWEGGVATLLGDELATGPVRAWLDDLVERELVERRRQARFPDERELRFRHGLVREAAYETLTPDDRGVAHRVAGTWLERAGERDALVLAEHFERGGEAARALPWFQRAAALAFEGSDLEATIRLAERGVACGAAGETLGALRLLQQMAHGWRGEWAPAERCALEAFALVPRGSVGWHEAAAALVLYTEVTGNFDNFLTVLNALREERLDERAGAPLAFAVFLVSASLAMLGQRDDARAFTARLESIAPAAAAADPAAAGWIEMTRAEMAAASMDLAATLAHYAAGLEHFERARDMRGLSMAQMNLGVHLALVGDYERGEEHLRVGLARAEHFRIVLIMGYAQAFLALVQSERGARGAPRALAARAVDWFAAAGDAVGEGIARSALARILANEGDHAGAEREARAACDRVAWLPPFRTGALATLALSLLAQGRTAE